MFERFKAWYRQRCFDQWLKEAYQPLYAFREAVSKAGTLELVATMDGLEEIIKELEETEGKDMSVLLKERWAAMQFKLVLEQYQETLLKLDEILDTIPKRPPKPPEYDITFNYFNDDEF